MGKAWNTGRKKPMADRKVITWRFNREAGMREYFVKRPDGSEQQVARSWAEHEVCSGDARYVEEVQ